MLLQVLPVLLYFWLVSFLEHLRLRKEANTTFKNKHKTRDIKIVSNRRISTEATRYKAAIVGLSEKYI